MGQYHNVERDRNVVELRKQGLTYTAIAAKLKISLSMVSYYVRKHNLQQLCHKPISGQSLRGQQQKAVPKIKTRDIRLRFARVRDLEHYCRCYVNAYVMELEGRHGGCGEGASPGELQIKQWNILLDIMFGILFQEGIVRKLEEEEEED